MRAERVMQEEDGGVWGWGCGGVQSKISRRGGRSNGVGWTLGKRRWEEGGGGGRDTAA